MNTLFQLSLLASFIAGMVALFAPCCITFLLPAYFANVFKEKRRVVLMTFIYSLGIFTVMLPVVLGARALTQLFFNLHDQTYVIGGLFLIFVGFSTLPFHLHPRDYFRDHECLLCASSHRSHCVIYFKPDYGSITICRFFLCPGNGYSAVPG